MTELVLKGPFKCHNCGSARVAPVQIASMDESGMHFVMLREKRRSKFLSIANHGIPIRGQGLLCVNCGLVWTAAALNEARRVLRESATPDLLAKVGLSESAQDELKEDASAKRSVPQRRR